MRPKMSITIFVLTSTIIGFDLSAARCMKQYGESSIALYDFR